MLVSILRYIKGYVRFTATGSSPERLLNLAAARGVPLWNPQPSEDGISAGMLVAEAAAYYRKQGKTLWDVLQEIYARYGFFAEDEPNIVLEGLDGLQRIGRMMQWFRENVPSSVAGIQVERVIDYIGGYEDIPPQNAIRLFLANGSWFAIRPSGTEPKIKFYFYSNQDSREKALAVNKKIRDEILDLIKAVD